MSDRNPIPGKFVWFEHVSRDAKRAQAFYAQVLDWKVAPFAMGGLTYEMIQAGEAMIGGYTSPGDDRAPSHWISYVSVEDVDATVRSAVAERGRVVDPPSDLPEVGRMARIADPEGAELCPFRNIAGDPADEPAAHGRWLWNELHCANPEQALRFYEKVFGFSHSGIDMGPEGTYHVISTGEVGRGGITGGLEPGAAPFWLPYACVDDVDAAVALSRELGAAILSEPEDIPGGYGRIATLRDPTGASIAVMKPGKM